MSHSPALPPSAEPLPVRPAPTGTAPRRTGLLGMVARAVGAAVARVMGTPAPAPVTGARLERLAQMARVEQFLDRLRALSTTDLYSRDVAVYDQHAAALRDIEAAVREGRPEVAAAIADRGLATLSADGSSAPSA